MDQSNCLNIVIGPTKSGKTTFCHVLSSSRLTITQSLFKFEITAEGCSSGQEIGNHCESQTKFATKIGKFCDFPGFGDTEGEKGNLRTLLELINQLETSSFIRIIILIEYSYFEVGDGILLKNITDEIIETFSLNEDDLSGIQVVISKTDEYKFAELNECFSDFFENTENFIIESIKSKKLSLHSFQEPCLKDSRFTFQTEFKQKFEKTLNMKQPLRVDRFLETLYSRVYIKLNLLRENYAIESIKFTSKEENIKNCLKSNEILCIDSNIVLEDEDLLFDSPIIIILPPTDESVISIEIKENSTCKFSSSIKKIYNSKALVLFKYFPSQKLTFPNPCADNFNFNWNFFRLESICVNGFLTEKLSHNNKFLDLIVYINDCSQQLEFDSRFPVKIYVVDIRFKLFINECMRTKNNISEKFISVKGCENFEDYLKICKKPDLNDDEKRRNLEIILMKLPTIFQLVMDNHYLRSFSQNPSEESDLLTIVSILIERYLKLISDCIDFARAGQTFPLEILAPFKEFCCSYLTLEPEEISVKNKNLIKSLTQILNQNISPEKLQKFFSVFDYFYSNYKEILYQYQITGDILIYNKSSNVLNNQGGSKPNDFKSFTLNAGQGISVGGVVASGIGIANIGRTLMLGGISNTAVTTTTGLSGILGAALVTGNLLINAICVVANSRYFDGELRFK